MQYTARRQRRHGSLLCALCGREIRQGSEYWSCNGASVCPACLGEFARGELAPYRHIRGKEVGP